MNLHKLSSRLRPTVSFAYLLYISINIPKFKNILQDRSLITTDCHIQVTQKFRHLHIQGSGRQLEAVVAEASSAELNPLSVFRTSEQDPVRSKNLWNGQNWKHVIEKLFMLWHFVLYANPLSFFSSGMPFRKAYWAILHNPPSSHPKTLPPWTASTFSVAGLGTVFSVWNTLVYI